MRRVCLVVLAAALLAGIGSAEAASGPKTVPDMVKDWLSHPVTRLHQRRLAKAALDEISQAKLNFLIQDCASVEDVGAKVIALANRTDGISVAYDHDPDMFYMWLMEVPNE